MTGLVTARDGEEIAARSNGQQWTASWHPPQSRPDGTAGICVTGDDEIVLVSAGERSSSRRGNRDSRSPIVAWSGLT